MLIGKGWSFIHIPKCGGTALRRHLTGKEVGDYLPLGSSCAIRSDWHRLPKKRPNGRVFTVVRHPASWLRSFWQDQSPERVGARRYLHHFWSDDLNEFVLNVCRESPGYVGTLFHEHIAYHSTKVFRLEDGLHRVLDWLGISHEGVGIVNASPVGPSLNDESLAMVNETEWSTMRKFGYQP